MATPSLFLKIKFSPNKIEIELAIEWERIEQNTGSTARYVKLTKLTLAYLGHRVIGINIFIDFSLIIRYVSIFLSIFWEFSWLKFLSKYTSCVINMTSSILLLPNPFCSITLVENEFHLEILNRITTWYLLQSPNLCWEDTCLIAN